VLLQEKVTACIHFDEDADLGESAQVQNKDSPVTKKSIY